MSDLNRAVEEQSQAANEACQAEDEEVAQPSEPAKGGGADKSKALSSRGSADYGKVSQDENKYD
jgi:hypothetical protein